MRSARIGCVNEIGANISPGDLVGLVGVFFSDGEHT